MIADYNDPEIIVRIPDECQAFLSEGNGGVVEIMGVKSQGGGPEHEVLEVRLSIGDRVYGRVMQAPCRTWDGPILEEVQVVGGSGTGGGGG